MKKLALFVVLISTLSLSGCSWFDGWFGGDGGSTASSSADAASAKAAISAAEAAIKKAAKAGGEWRDTKKKFLKKAKAAASKKDFGKAVKLANKAREQGEMGYAQAMSQKNAGPWVF